MELAIPDVAAARCETRISSISIGVNKIFAGFLRCNIVTDDVKPKSSSLPILSDRSTLRGSDHDTWSSKQEPRGCCSLLSEGTEVGGRFAHYLQSATSGNEVIAPMLNRSKEISQ